jgi:hypothetical protein
MSAHRQTDRAFGLMFAVVFSLVFAIAQFGFSVRLEWALWVASGFLILALLAPWLLMPLNRLWEKFAFRLGFVSNHVLLGSFFFLFVFPISLMLRIFGSDPMQRKFEPKSDTYWTKVTRHTNRETLGDMF